MLARARGVVLRPLNFATAADRRGGAMQNVVNKVKSAALGVADSLTPVLKVSVHCSQW